MKKIKALLCLILCFLSLFFSCQLNETEQKKIMFIPKSAVASFWKITISGFKTAIAEYNAFGDVRDPIIEEDYKKQIEIINQAIAEDFDAIVMSSIHYELLVEAVENALDNGLEVVIIDSDVNVDEIQVRVSTDNYKAGFIMGEQVAKDINYSGNVALLMYDVVAKNGLERMTGFIEALNQYGMIKLVHTQNTLSNIPDAEENTRKIIELYPEIHAIASFNELTTVGMGKAIKALSRKDIYCIGFDNNSTVISLLEEGIFDSLIIQNQFAMGYLGCEYAIKLINGEKFKNFTVDTGVHVITKENMYDAEIQTILFPFEDEIGTNMYNW